MITVNHSMNKFIPRLQNAVDIVNTAHQFDSVRDAKETRQTARVSRIWTVKHFGYPENESTNPRICDYDADSLRFRDVWP